MLAAPGGGGGTDWSAMNVAEMWALIANQDTASHYQLLTGWQKSYELLIEHLGQMQNYRDNLASAWPPEKSPASAAYIGQLDDMISHLQKTYDAAVTNHTVLAGATLSIGSTRDDLKAMYDEYTANEAKLAKFAAEPKPVQYGKAPILPPKPPVSPSRQEELNSQARVLMSELSTDLVQAQTSLTTPTKFAPPYLIDEKKAAEAAGTPIPVTSGGFDVGTGVGRGSTSGRAKSSLPNSTSGATSATIPHTTQGHEPGLVLGGANAAAVPSSPAMSAPSTPGLTSPVGGGLSSGGGQATTFPAAPLPDSVLKPNAFNVAGNSVGEGPNRIVPIREPIQGVRTMPPGVIGAPPGSGAQAAGGRVGPQRVNPVGGVIDNGAFPAKGSRGGSADRNQMLSQSNGRGRKSGSDQPSSWDPDNPWETYEGVDPVVLPVREQRVDPGPAIGLV